MVVGSGTMGEAKALCVIPVFNEAINLPVLFEDVEGERVADDFDLLFINDGSSDQSSDLIRNRGFSLISHEQNQGYGACVRDGIRRAVKEGYDFFAIFPGDHQRRAGDLKRMLQLARSGQYDVVVGSKFHIYDHKLGPIRRRIGNIIFSKMSSWLWGSPIEDVLSGFKVYRVAAIRDFFELCPVGYPFDIVFNFHSSLRGLRYAEIPVACRYDQHTSKMRSVLWVSFKMLSYVIKHCILFCWPLFRRFIQVRLGRTSSATRAINKVNEEA
jgi:glycosyltransferase involved in cell wall biosynthesis